MKFLFCMGGMCDQQQLIRFYGDLDRDVFVKKFLLL